MRFMDQLVLGDKCEDVAEDFDGQVMDGEQHILSVVCVCKLLVALVSVFRGLNVMLKAQIA